VFDPFTDNAMALVFIAKINDSEFEKTPIFSPLFTSVFSNSATFWTCFAPLNSQLVIDLYIPERQCLPIAVLQYYINSPRTYQNIGRRTTELSSHGNFLFNFRMIASTTSIANPFEFGSGHKADSIEAPSVATLHPTSLERVT
jgi:hypothetical protein